MGRNQVKIDNLPYNSDMHGQTSRPLGSFNEEKTHTQVNIGNIFSGEKIFTAVWFSQLTSTCASPPVTWPVHGCTILQAASVKTVQPALR